MKIAYPESITLARLPTPLEFAPRLTRFFKDRNPLYFKRDDLTGGSTSGNKIRKLEFLLAEAKQQKAEVVITAGGVQSNHCRATAAACAKLGLRCHLILRGEAKLPYDANLLLDRLCGAEISFHSREEFHARQQEIVSETKAMYEKMGLKAYYTPIGGSVATGAWGYIRGLEELCAQIDAAKRTQPELKGKPWYIVSAVGSGGTLAGLLFGQMLLKRQDLNILGVNVCDDAEYFTNEIKQIAAEFRDKYRAPINPEKVMPTIVEGYVGPGYAVAYEEELNTLKLLAQLEGIVLDPVYTGKAFHGLADQLQKGTVEPGVPVIFIHTGGIYSLFAYRDLFI